MKRQVIHTGEFDRAFKRLAKQDSSLATRLAPIFRQMGEDVFDPSLKTHKLKANLAGWFACRAGFDLRILFRIVSGSDAETILMLGIGKHEDVY